MFVQRSFNHCATAVCLVGVPHLCGYSLQDPLFSFGFPCSPDYSVGQMSAARKTGEELRITKEFVVTNKLGIHARPAAMFVKTANRFECDVYVEKDGERVNGKSIMGLMMLAAGPGSKLLVLAEGEDAAKAVVELEALLRRKFDED
jgi:phosphocarrier protein HPr